MSTETIGMVSGLLVMMSIIPYSIRIYQSKIHPNLTGWSLWTLIGLALLLTYESSGAKANIWPAVFGFTNPLLITILVAKQKGGWSKPDKWEWLCILLCVVSLVSWLTVRNVKELAQFALYLAIIADGCAAIPTFRLVWMQPDSDRPFAWAFFAVGYGLAILAITNHTFANYALPLWMFFTGLGIAFPLAIHRWKQRVPLAEWI